MDQAARGAAALKAKNYPVAIKKYTEAIRINPTAVDYYIKRSTAHQRSSPPDYTAALQDAEVAVVLAHKRAKRELIKDAQLRRGIALYFLDRFADADFCFNIVKRLDEKEKTLAIWTAKTASKLKELSEDDEKRKAAIKELPEVEIPSASTHPTSSEAKPVSPARPLVTPAHKIKHDWYQTADTVCITLLAKGVPKDQALVEIDQDSLSISFPAGDSNFDFTVDPLFGPVIPSETIYNITSTKLEVVLTKASHGKWKSLEGDRGVNAPAEEDKPSISSRIPSSKTNETAPAYPTSSRYGPKNWDKITQEMTAKKSKGSGEGNDDGLDLDDDDGDETARFFKQLYKGATPEQQRAMMKSYSESGGTVLSTDWSQVGVKTVTPEPPEGMEAKKFNE